MSLVWNWKIFDELTTAELYSILQLRQEVFVVEQQCWYLDADNKDQFAHHLLGKNQDGILLAYARIIPPGKQFENEASFGRIITSLKIRRDGYGKHAMALILEKIVSQFGKVPVRIEAQAYLVPFYHSFGFHAEGEEFDMDGLPHIEMLRP